MANDRAEKTVLVIIARGGTANCISCLYYHENAPFWFCETTDSAEHIGRRKIKQFTSQLVKSGADVLRFVGIADERKRSAKNEYNACHGAPLRSTRRRNRARDAESKTYKKKNIIKRHAQSRYFSFCGHRPNAPSLQSERRFWMTQEHSRIACQERVKNRKVTTWVVKIRMVQTWTV